MNNLKKYIKILMESLNQDDMSVFKDWLIDNLYKKGYEDYSQFPDGPLPGEKEYEWKLRKIYNPSLFILIYTGFSAQPPYNFLERETVGVGIVRNNELTQYNSFKPSKYEKFSDFMRDFENARLRREHIASGIVPEYNMEEI